MRHKGTKVFIFFTLFSLVLPSRGLCEDQNRSNAGYFLAAGVPLICAGVVSVLSGAAWEPVIDDLNVFIDQTQEGTEPRRYAIDYRNKLESKQQTLKTAGYVMIGMGAASFIIAMQENRMSKKPKITPVITKDVSGLILSVKF